MFIGRILDFFQAWKAFLCCILYLTISLLTHVVFVALASVPASETESVNTENQNGEDEKTPCCGPLW